MTIGKTKRRNGNNPRRVAIQVLTQKTRANLKKLVSYKAEIRTTTRIGTAAEKRDM